MKITEALRRETERRILAHAEKHYGGKYTRIAVRFRGPFCYIDAYQEPDDQAKPIPGSGETLEEYRERRRRFPLHLCRLRHCGQNQWSVAFYTYSHEQYEPSFFESGSFHGRPEVGLDVGAVYFQG